MNQSIKAVSSYILSEPTAIEWPVVKAKERLLVGAEFTRAVTAYLSDGLDGSRPRARSVARRG
jgi:hypothetical protein